MQPRQVTPAIGRNEPCPCGSGRKSKNCCGGQGLAQTAARSPFLVLGLVLAVAALAFVAVREGRQADEPEASEPAAEPVSLSTIDLSGSQPSTQPTLTPVTPGQPGALTPQPPGPVPPGKVWSPEHGHWHDVAPQGPQAAPLDLGAGVSTTLMDPSLPSKTSGQVPNVTLTPQPPGPVPEGKVWSPEHGHWHDATPPPPPGGATPIPIQLTPGQTTTVQGTVGEPAAPQALTPQPPGPVPPGKVWSPEHGHWHDAPQAGTPAPGGSGQP